MHTDRAVPAIRVELGEARVNITYADQNGDLPDPVQTDATDADIKEWVTEALRGGGIPGIPASPNADLTSFQVDRFGPTEGRPYNLISVRPKATFGVVYGQPWTRRFDRG